MVLHGCAALLYALSLLQYEIAAGFILLGGCSTRSEWMAPRPAPMGRRYRGSRDRSPLPGHDDHP